MSKPENLNAHTINEAENNVPNQRQHLEYVAVSRATDTATIISNNVKSEDSPLNHWKEDSQNDTTPVAATQNIASQKFYTKQNVDEYVQNLKADGIPSETIHVEYIPATETEDDYWVVTVGKKPSEETRTAQEIMQQTMERLNTIKGIHVMKRADMQKFLQEHPNALNKVQQALAVQKEMQEIKAKAIANGTFMKAPNGKPTKLNERQWLQVRTKNFINWFGDWINDHER